MAEKLNSCAPMGRNSCAKTECSDTCVTNHQENVCIHTKKIYDSCRDKDIAS